MDPVDEMFVRQRERQALFVLKILLFLFTNDYLLEHGKGITNIILFDIGILILWFTLWLRSVLKIYEMNLLLVPRISKQEARVAALDGRKIDLRCS